MAPPQAPRYALTVTSALAGDAAFSVKLTHCKASALSAGKILRAFVAAHGRKFGGAGPLRSA